MKSLSELEKLIAELSADYCRLNLICESAIVLGCMASDGKLHDAIWETFERSVKRNDFDGLISWFIYENGCGEKGMDAGINGRMKPIKTPKDLAKLILKTR